MNIYKFDIKIGRDGSIHLPFLPDLVNQEAEVLVVPKTKVKYRTRNKKKGRNFVKTWTGFISENNESASRLDYISEKYK